MAAQKTRARKPASAAPRGADRPRMSLAEAMKALEKAGSAQARKTYARHGATEPLFGVSFATLGTLVKRIGVDHDLALALWDTGNFDARNLALKIADPAAISSRDLDRWAREMAVRMCLGYVAMLAAEGPHGRTKAQEWLGSKDEGVASSGWALVGQLALRDPETPDAWFSERLVEIERGIHSAPNVAREAMNGALIAIGGRSAALRKAALAAAKRIGPVDVDHGDTDCKTRDATTYVEKMWAHAKAKGFETPAAQERKRASPRTRC